MKIQIVCVGKIKEKFYRDAIAEYTKRLSRYCKLEILEVSDEPIPEKASEAVLEKILETEGERILKQLKDSTYVIALAIQGKKLDSIQFSKMIEDCEQKSGGCVAFIIGGSLGLHSSVLQRSQMQVSFSDMTFPHQLMRVILTEQIYRGYRILKKEPYHK